MYKPNTKNIKVYTPHGYKRFGGIQKLYKPCVVLHTTFYALTCAHTHPICVNYEDQVFITAKDVKIGDQVYTSQGYQPITDVINRGYEVVYDLIDVDGDNTYYTNGILSHNCVFRDSGDSSIDIATYDMLEKNCQEPTILLDNGAYKIWKEPQPDRLYAAGIDVGEGVGKDASIINIFDITEIRQIEQVAQWYSNNTIPVEFSNKCFEILQNWGYPFVLIERNNQGAQVVDRLGYDLGYENIVSYGSKQANRDKAQLGMISHTNTKYKAITNMRYFINEMNAVILRDKHTLEELKTFIRFPNGTWKAELGKKDDRVMSTAWALMILEKELTEKYFEIVELDAFGKPLKLEKMEFGVKYFVNPTSIYTGEQTDEKMSHIGPIVFGWGSAADEIHDMEVQGWQQLSRM